MSQSNIDRCLKLAKKMPMIEAVKKVNPSDEEIQEIIDLQIELLGREKYTPTSAGRDAGATGERERRTRGVKDILARMDERDAEFKRIMENLVTHIEKQRATFTAFCEACQEVVDLFHPAPDAQAAREGSGVPVGGLRKLAGRKLTVAGQAVKFAKPDGAA